MKTTAETTCVAGNHHGPTPAAAPLGRVRADWRRRRIAALLCLAGLALAAAAAAVYQPHSAVAQNVAQPPAPASPAQAQVPAQAPNAAPAGEVKPAQAAEPGADAQPVTHAKGAAISTCIPALSELSRIALDAPHAALSVWNREAPNDHMFSSIVGLRYESPQAPQAVSVLTVAPKKDGKCDGASVQVQPSVLPCQTIAGNLLKQPKAIAQDLNGVTIVQSEGSIRFALLPTAGGGCAVVGVGSYFAKP